MFVVSEIHNILESTEVVREPFIREALEKAVALQQQGKRVSLVEETKERDGSVRRLSYSNLLSQGQEILESLQAREAERQAV